MFGEDEDDEENKNNENIIIERPKSCGVLQFHNGTEEAMFIYVKQRANEGDVSGIIKSVDEFCYQRHWMMHIGDRKSKYLEKYVSFVANRQCNDQEDSQGEICVELGSYCGYSALCIARLLNPGSLLICIERELACVRWTERLVKYAGLESKVVVLHATVKSSIETSLLLNTILAKRSNIKPAIDLVFIDHDKSSYCKDLQLIIQQNLLRSGSIVIADNIYSFNQPIQDYLDYVRNPHGPLKTLDTVMEYIEYSVSPTLATDDSITNNTEKEVNNGDHKEDNIDGMEISVYK